MLTTMMATTRPRGRHHSMQLKTIVAIIVGYEVLVMFIHSSRRDRGRNRLLPRRDSRLGSGRGGGCAIAASTSAICGSDEGGSRAKDCVELGVDGEFDVDRVGGCFGVDEGDEDA